MGFNNNWVFSHKLASLVHIVSIYLLMFFSFISKYIFRYLFQSLSLIIKISLYSMFILYHFGLNTIEEVCVLGETFFLIIIQNFKGSFVINQKIIQLLFTTAYPDLILDSRLQKCGGFLKNNDNKKIILLEKEKKTELHLKFKFPSFEEFSRTHKEKISSFMFNSELVPCASTFNAFIEKIIKEVNGKVVVGFGGGQNGKIIENEEFYDELRFLCDDDFGDIIDGENEKIKLESEFEFSGFEQNHGNLGRTEMESDVELNSGFLCENDFNGTFEDENEINLEQKNDANKLEPLWEHQELIDQLRMELRKVRATGLPTILEESESPRIKEKPWEIEEKLDRRRELHKSYQGYTHTMRKFDILNYQKTYAMGFLELSDPFRSKSQQKSSAESLWSFKHKRHKIDPVKKLVKEVHGDLEVVYVGQMCSSWEFLHWQYDRVLDFWNTNPRGVHRYNEVAAEFQQFRVLVERFVEDEPFQGPRVQSYVKSRCVLRNLLQVPLIKEDNLKGKNKSMKRERENEYGVTSEMLVEMVEKSIQIFWRFIRSDKDYCNSVTFNSHKKLPELHNYEDLKLLLELRKTLQKKEKKLKYIMRSENCILRKSQHNRENDWDQALNFFAQVDMKLVSRVLNMSKITRDQLIWCRNKLSRLNFVNRKITVEPGFLLFPCN